MKKFKIGLLPKILIAIVLGIGAGLGLEYIHGAFQGEWMSTAAESTARVFVTINGIFSQFLGFVIPLIIVALVTTAIADIGNKAGKMLLVTVAIAYGSTVFAGLVSYLTGAALFPTMIDSTASLNEVQEFASLTPFFEVNIPPLMGVMTALVLAFTLGLGLASTQHDTLMKATHGFEEIMVKTIKVAIIPLLPLYIFGIFLDMAYVGKVFSILSVFIKIIGIIFLIHIGILLLQFIIA